jgi:hypothetical protein
VAALSIDNLNLKPLTIYASARDDKIIFILFWRFFSQKTLMENHHAPFPIRFAHPLEKQIRFYYWTHGL